MTGIAAQALEAKVNQLEEEHSTLRNELLRARTALAAAETTNGDLKGQLLALQQVVALYGNGLLTVPWVHLVDLSSFWPGAWDPTTGGYDREPVALHLGAFTGTVTSRPTNDWRATPSPVQFQLAINENIKVEHHRARGTRLLLALVPEVRW